jgi:Patatin-like phospholipase
MIAIVLSGGFAFGSFEVGAVRYLYNTGVRPNIICGTSVGAINGAKLAEGEGTDPVTGQPTGLPGLENIWLTLNQNSDVYVEGSFLTGLEGSNPDLYQKLSAINFIVPDPDPAPGIHVVASSGPLPTVVSETISAPGRAVNWVVGGVSGIFDQVMQCVDICNILNAVSTGQEQLPLGLFDQQPLLDLINQDLNLQLVNEWANQGGRLRFATVGLLSGKVRYATENGQLLERDNSTVVSTLPTFQPVPPACQPQANYVTQLENQLSALMINRPSPGDPDYESWLAEVQDLNIQINDAKQALQQCKDNNNAPHIPDLRPAINGSLALPAFLIPQQLDGELYVDGGIRDVMPVAMAAELGATEIVAVSDSPPLGPTQSITNAFDVAMRALTGVAIDEVAYEAAHSVQTSNTVNVTLIQSTFSMPNDAYTIHPALIRINTSYGYMRAADTVSPTLIRPDRSHQLSDDITAFRRLLFQFEGVASYTDPAAQTINVPMLRWGKGILTLLINERSSLGGPMSPDVTGAPSNWEQHYPWSPPAATPFDAMGPVPAGDPASFVPGNNTLLQEQYPDYNLGPEPINTVYVILGGAGFAVPNAQELAALGLQDTPIRPIPAGAMVSGSLTVFDGGVFRDRHTTEFLPSIPFEGMLIKERGSDSVFLISNGMKCFVSPPVFRQGGFDSNAVLVAPAGGLASIPDGPPLQLPGPVLEFLGTPGEGWQGTDVTAQPGNNGWMIVGDPAALYDADGRLHIFGRADNDHVLEFIYTPGQPQPWQAWDHTLDPGNNNWTIAGDPTVLFSADGATHIFARGENDHILEFIGTPGEGWQAWDHTLDPGNNNWTIAGDPTVLFSADGATHIFARGVRPWSGPRG